MTQSSTRTIIMGTRGSPLALAQARQFAQQLEAAHQNLVVEERIIRTTGDKNQTSSLPAIGGKGVFTLEIEAALLDGSIDFAVHSLKDLPPDLPDGLMLGCIPKRESASDVLIVREACEQPHPEIEGWDVSPMRWYFLRNGARVGTSSLRRRATLLHLRSDLQIDDIRGNVDTRLRKMHDENFDAIVLAEAGLRRLGFVNEQRIETPQGCCFLHRFFDWESVPAPGQGALAIETRADDNRVLDLLRALEHDVTRREITIERAVMRALQAGCSTPLGVRATADATEKIHVMARVLSPDGQQNVEAEHLFHFANNAEHIGQDVAKELLRKGARELLATQ